jgi:hypothetical protein
MGHRLTRTSLFHCPIAPNTPSVAALALTSTAAPPPLLALLPAAAASKPPAAADLAPGVPGTAKPVCPAAAAAAAADPCQPGRGGSSPLALLLGPPTAPPMAGPPLGVPTRGSPPAADPMKAPLGIRSDRRRPPLLPTAGLGRAGAPAASRCVGGITRRADGRRGVLQVLEPLLAPAPAPPPTAAAGLPPGGDAEVAGAAVAAPGPAIASAAAAMMWELADVALLSMEGL